MLGVPADLALPVKVKAQRELELSHIGTSWELRLSSWSRGLILLLLDFRVRFRPRTP